MKNDTNENNALDEAINNYKRLAAHYYSEIQKIKCKPILYGGEAVDLYKAEEEFKKYNYLYEWLSEYRELIREKEKTRKN